MSRNLTITLAKVMLLVMTICAIPFAGFCHGSILASKAFAMDLSSYKTGEIITFGKYPQSKVEDSETVSALNAKATEWQSYGYMSGSGSDWRDGSAQESDFMKYCDIEYNGSLYRGVTFSAFRPFLTNLACGPTNYTYQFSHGYNINTTYWFKYEPLRWKVLDPSNGFVLCEYIIDSQPYSNTLYYYNDTYYKNNDYSIIANNYYESSIRQWLNNEFYNTAFNDEEKSQIDNSILRENTCWPTYPQFDSESSSDAITLLSYEDMTNTSYGFSKTCSDFDINRRAHGTDYAKCQGSCSNKYYRTADGEDTTYWWMRSSHNYSDFVHIVDSNGDAENFRSMVSDTMCGVRPAFNFKKTTDTDFTNEMDLTDIEVKLPADSSSALSGDINGDGYINSTDAMLVLQYTVQEITFTPEQIKLADVNKDNAINSTDSLWILEYTVGKRQGF